MVIFHSYVSLPEGIGITCGQYVEESLKFMARSSRETFQHGYVNSTMLELLGLSKYGSRPL